jgi:hypothetical protein
MITPLLRIPDAEVLMQSSSYPLNPLPLAAEYRYYIEGGLAEAHAAQALLLNIT